MRRNNSIDSRHVISRAAQAEAWSATRLVRGTALAILTLAVLVLAVTPAVAVPANFDSTGIGFIPSADLMALPGTTIDASIPLLSAGDSTGGGFFEVDFTGSSPGSVCILADSQPGICQADLSNVTTAYSAIVTLEISDLNTSEITGPFTLALTMLTLVNSENGDVYAANEVSIALDPMAPGSLDTSAVPGFSFDGSFDSLVRIQDAACMNSGGDCNYLGWIVSGIGDTATFRFDMATAPNGRDTPKLLFNAIPVPEPGAALLLGLGLAGLSAAGQRVGRERG